MGENDTILVQTTEILHHALLFQWTVTEELYISSALFVLYFSPLSVLLLPFSVKLSTMDLQWADMAATWE